MVAWWSVEKGEVENMKGEVGRRFKPYPKYKDSGVEWLGEVPVHWEVKRIKYLARIASGFAPPPSYDKLIGEYPVYGSNGLIGYCDVFMVSEETLAVGRVGASGLVNVVPGFSWVSDNALLLRDLRPTTRLQWLRYVLETMNLGTQAAKNAQPIITGTFLANQALPAPSEQEQLAIASFLDHETAKIDALIAQKDRLIELLQEKRTALITRAVTKGLNPNVPMKDSGVEWLGGIPVNWKTMLLKRLASIRYGLGEPPRELLDGIPFLCATNVKRGTISDIDLKKVDPDDVPWGRDPVLRKGEIIVVRSGAYTGDSALIPAEYDGAIVGYDMVLHIERAYPEFIAWALLSKYVLDAQIEICRTRAAQPHLNAEELGGVFMFLPGEKEQRIISEFLTRKIDEADALVAKIQKGIERLKEYRTALISATVTGKIDVREAA